MKVSFSALVISLLVGVSTLPAYAQLPDGKQLPFPSAKYQHQFRNDSDRQRVEQDWRSRFEKQKTPQKNVLPPDQVLYNGFTSWQWRYPLPQGNHLFDVQMIDSNHIVAVGGGGTVMQSDNGGTTWRVHHNVAGGVLSEINGVSFTDTNTGIAVGDGGVIRTSDGGKTWTQPPGGQRIYLSDIHSIDANTAIVVGIWEILRTTDGGLTWTQQLYDASVNFGSVHFSDADTGMAVGFRNSTGEGKIFRTTDGGINWIQQATPYNYLYSVYFVNASTGFIGFTNGVLRTTDGGLSWTQILIGAFINDFHFFDTNTGIAVGGISGVGGRFYRTTNGGDNWTEIIPTGGPYNLISVHFANTSRELQ